MKKAICLVVVLVSVFVYGFAIAGKGEGGGSAPVTVVNTDLNPVPVVVSNTRELVIFHGGCVAGTDLRNCLTHSADNLVVPEGKRLVIENFSCSAAVPSGVSLSCYIRPKIVDGNTSTTHDVFISTSPVSIDDLSTISAGQPIKLYLKPGDEVGFGGFRNQSTPSAEVGINFSLQGYYEVTQW